MKTTRQLKSDYEIGKWCLARSIGHPLARCGAKGAVRAHLNDRRMPSSVYLVLFSQLFRPYAAIVAAVYKDANVQCNSIL